MSPDQYVSTFTDRNNGVRYWQVIGASGAPVSAETTDSAAALAEFARCYPGKPVTIWHGDIGQFVNEGTDV